MTQIIEFPLKGFLLNFRRDFWSAKLTYVVWRVPGRGQSLWDTKQVYRERRSTRHQDSAVSKIKLNKHKATTVKDRNSAVQRPPCQPCSVVSAASRHSHRSTTFSLIAESYLGGAAAVQVTTGDLAPIRDQITELEVTRIDFLGKLVA
jgi:hypothetical protein